MPVRYDKPMVENNSIRDEKSTVEFFKPMAPQYKKSDMVFTQNLEIQMNEVLGYVRYENKIFDEWGLGKVIHRSGGKSFNLYGPSGTGKTMMAHIIADELNKRIMQVNYAEIESKYVGETAKNLQYLFECAEHNEGILFFDEADALLSKRVTDMSSASDVSVNQTRSVLLKLLDEHRGIIIFATNFLSNYDTAFLRRITKHIKFELPNYEQRVMLWKHFLVDTMPSMIDIERIARQFDSISGSDIKSSVLSAAIKAVSEGRNIVDTDDIVIAMNRIIEAKEEGDIPLITEGSETE